MEIQRIFKRASDLNEMWWESEGIIHLKSDSYRITIEEYPDANEKSSYEITLGAHPRKRCSGHRISAGILGCLYKMGELPEGYTQETFEPGDEVLYMPGGASEATVISTPTDVRKEYVLENSMDCWQAGEWHLEDPEG